jgi:hypothetical protein
MAPPGQSALAPFKEKLLVQSERSEKPVFNDELKIGWVLFARPHQRFFKL